MKKEAYEALELEVIKFDTEDIITTSGETGGEIIPPDISDEVSAPAPEAAEDADELPIEAE